MSTVESIAAKYGHEIHQADAFKKSDIEFALKETQKEIKDLQKQLADKIAYVKVLNERMKKAV